MKNLQNYGVLEMDAKEICETQGGFALFIGLIALTISAYNSADEMAAAAIEAYKDSECNQVCNQN
jgi:hypothetical protein